jgi:ABC-type transporter Mla MlaB component
LAGENNVPETPRGGRPPPPNPSARVLVVEVRSITKPDLATVEALCRLHVSVQGLGCSIRLRNASLELQELLGVCGLSDVLPLSER